MLPHSGLLALNFNGIQHMDIIDALGACPLLMEPDLTIRAWIALVLIFSIAAGAAVFSIAKAAEAVVKAWRAFRGSPWDRWLESNFKHLK